VSTFRARVSVDDGTLHTSRPLTAPEHVRDLIDSVVYDVSQPERAGLFAAVELVIETPEESEHPIADSVTGTSSVPLDAGHMTVDPDGPRAPDVPEDPAEDERPLSIPTVPVPA
jgi:hypothetical protein